MENLSPMGGVFRLGEMACGVVCCVCMRVQLPVWCSSVCALLGEWQDPFLLLWHQPRTETKQQVDFELWFAVLAGVVLCRRTSPIAVFIVSCSMFSTLVVPFCRSCERARICSYSCPNSTTSETHGSSQITSGV
jgi:hypothetical protein